MALLLFLISWVSLCCGEEITYWNYPSLLSDSSSCKMVKFYATWCGACTKVAPEWTDAAMSDLKERCSFVEVNVDHNRALAELFGVRSIPAFYGIANQKIVRFPVERETFVRSSLVSFLDRFTQDSSLDSFPVAFWWRSFLFLSYHVEVSMSIMTSWGLLPWQQVVVGIIAMSIVGLIWGLLLFQLVTFLWPSTIKTSSSSSEKKNKKTKKD